ncbi:erythromycin esterase family protein [Amycolatopsis suaedae]|uniref:Erythromycin esterase family protein n=1 Tax=Amycolatopsis suaedae TaxID=2510978 RepID=A0A4Q7J893_9PSEU|nr:erythromycin esterase family protein [Amycolatopsis suaedae]RZQ62304.1 erythromycin esterase family protein [Amycolatopsis suaedae]
MSEDRSSFVAWARESAHALDGDELALGPADLTPLARIVGEARVVGLGETWHPVHEFLSLNFRLARFLVEMGFTGVLLEGSLATARQLDGYVNGTIPDRSALVLSSLWDNDETMDFLDWLRGHNASLPPERRVHVFGLDSNVLIMENTRAPGTTVEDVIAYVEQVDPGWAPTVLDVARRVFAGFSAATASVEDRRRANFAYFGTLAADLRNQLREALAVAVARLGNNRDEYRGRGSAEDFEWALHRLVVLQQAQRMYEAHLGSVADGLAVRVHAMADNARWAIDRLGAGARTVVLATSVHLARAPWAYSGSETEIPSVGMRLAAWYGTGYVALSTAFGGGTFEPPNPVTGTTDIPAGAPDSIDRALAEAGGSAFRLLDLCGRTAVAPPAGWLAEPRPLQPMQNVASPPRYAFPGAFDALVYADQVHSARQRSL